MVANGAASGRAKHGVMAGHVTRDATHSPARQAADSVGLGRSKTDGKHGGNGDNGLHRVTPLVGGLFSGSSAAGAGVP